MWLIFTSVWFKMMTTVAKVLQLYGQHNEGEHIIYLLLVIQQMLGDILCHFSLLVVLSRTLQLLTFASAPSFPVISVPTLPFLSGGNTQNAGLVLFSRCLTSSKYGITLLLRCTLLIQ